MKKQLFFLFTLFMVFMFACQRADIGSDGTTTTDMENLIIDESFNFESTKSIEVDITLPSTVVYTDIRSRVSIYDKSLDEGGVLLYAGTADSDGILSTEIIVPSYLSELYVSTFAGNETLSIDDAPVLSKALKSYSVDFGEDYSSNPPPEIEPESAAQQKTVILFQKGEGVKSAKKMFMPNVISNGGFDVDEFGSVLNSWSSAMVDDNLWHVTRELDGYVDIVEENGDNALQISRSNYRYGGVTQLITAGPGDRITFSANLKASGSGSKTAWLYIIPRNSNGSALAFYSRQVNYFSSYWDDAYVAATMPSQTASVQILLWQHIYGGNIYWDDIYVTGPVDDADGDGINDEEDDYPNDWRRAYNIYYPNEEAYGSLAYEDNWPGRGDYDFNDLVVDYQFKQVVNASNALVELESKFKFRAIGASFTNGFGFEINTPSSNISNITGQSIVDSYINLGPNNAEVGQSNASIIVTDNAFTQLPHPGGGTGVNTTPGQTYVDPVTMTVFTSFETPVPLSQAGSPPYNPFIIVDQERGREVHLPNKTPTTLVNTALFGTQNDDSNPSIGKYYKTQNNLPWAIDIPVSFDYPVEKALIINAYLHFAEWAESSGTLYTDWYLDESGYRNSGNIYQVAQ